VKQKRHRQPAAGDLLGCHSNSDDIYGDIKKHSNSKEPNSDKSTGVKVGP